MGKYEVTILEHINTKVNVIADALSRQHDPLPSVFPTERLQGPVIGGQPEAKLARCSEPTAMGYHDPFLLTPELLYGVMGALDRADPRSWHRGDAMKQQIKFASDYGSEVIFPALNGGPPSKAGWADTFEEIARRLGQDTRGLTAPLSGCSKSRAGTGLWKHATKEGDEAAPQKACKGWRFIRPASPGYQEMSLEDKMAAFQKRGNQDVQVFLDSLTKHQREALWQRFSSARQSLKDKDADQLGLMFQRAKAQSLPKVEVAQWMEVKAAGLLDEGAAASSKASMALGAVLNKPNKQLAIKNQDTDDEDDGRASGHASGSKKGGKDGQVVEADLLSEVGSKLPKEEAHKRVTRMIKLIKAVKKDVGETKGKALEKTLADLNKLDKQGKKINLEQAKGKHFDAALEIKKAALSKPDHKKEAKAQPDAVELNDKPGSPSKKKRKRQIERLRDQLKQSAAKTTKVDRPGPPDKYKRIPSSEWQTITAASQLVKGPKRCRYFNSSMGCSMGDKCRFKHLRMKCGAAHVM
ncbi:Kinase D-interacting substrate of 220 kDa, partial [Durusdinium trenchii]